MEITQREFESYNPMNIIPGNIRPIVIPDIGRRVRILSCIFPEPPIHRFILYEGIVQEVIQNERSNQIVLRPDATETIIYDGNVTNGAAPLIDGRIVFPMILNDVSSYYWKYLNESDVNKTKRPIYEPIKPMEQLEQIAKKPLIFAGKSIRKTKKSKIKRRKTLKYYSRVKVNG